MSTNPTSGGGGPIGPAGGGAAGALNLRSSSGGAGVTSAASPFASSGVNSFPNDNNPSNNGLFASGPRNQTANELLELSLGGRMAAQGVDLPSRQGVAPPVNHQGPLAVQLPAAGGFRASGAVPSATDDDHQRERGLGSEGGGVDDGLEEVGSPDDGLGGMKKLVSFGLHSNKQSAEL